MAANPGAAIFLGGTNPNTGSYDWGDVPERLQFVLSTGVAQTTATIPVTITGYVPKTLKTARRRS